MLDRGGKVSLAIGGGQFERVADTVTERTADLLSTQVSVIDAHGRIVASSESGLLGVTLYPEDQNYVNAYLRVPLRINNEAGEVLIAEPRNGEAISPRLAQVLAELIIDQTAVVDRLPNKHELKNKLIHDLLHGSTGEEATILREAQILGMDLGPPRVVILIDAADYILAPPSRGVGNPSEARIRRRAQLVIGNVVDFFELPNDTICAYIGNGEVAVLKASNRKNLGIWVDQDRAPDAGNPSWANLAALKRAALALLARLRTDTRADISVGIGRYHAGLRGLSRSYEDARAALSLGCRFHGHNQVHCLDGLGIAAFVGVSDERTKVELAKYVLSPLDHEPELLVTLQTFFADDCCPSETAAALSIHRNTLSYRLDKITSLTGLDPRRFDDAVQIRLALTLRSLQIDPRDCADA
ncbi:MAG: CdaR family transcriptional regulator [Chloroflexi bacterium]|nr:MAG: CdaR family transcriptional regulator [Chloroflexota bacterium]